MESPWVCWTVAESEVVLVTPKQNAAAICCYCPCERISMFMLNDFLNWSNQCEGLIIISPSQQRNSTAALWAVPSRPCRPGAVFTKHFILPLGVLLTRAKTWWRMVHTVITVITSSLHKILCIFVCSNIYGGKQQTIINMDSTNKRRQRANTMFFTHKNALGLYK